MVQTLQWRLWEAEQGGRVVTPVRLISVGLTNNPNIPVPAIANDAGADEAEADQVAEAGADEGGADEGSRGDAEVAEAGAEEAGAEEAGADEAGADEAGEDEDFDDVMKKRLADLLGADESASLDDLLALLEERLVAAGETVSAGEGDAQAAETTLDEEARDEVAAENEASAAASLALVSAMRRERVGAAVDALCLSGRLPVAERESAETLLMGCENDAAYAQALEGLGTASPVLKTTAVTEGLAESGKAVTLENDAARKTTQRGSLMEAEMQANGGSFSKAWSKLSRSHPALFT